MARLYFDGTDSLELSLKDIAAMSEDEKKTIIQSGAEVVVNALKSVLENLELIDSKQLIDNVSFKFKLRDGEPFAQISSYGKRKKPYTGKRKKTKGKTHGSYQGTNTELLYLLEFGTPRMQPWHPVGETEDVCIDDVTAAMAAAFDEYLKTKNL